MTTGFSPEAADQETTAPDDATHFYERLRERIGRFVARKGRAAGRVADFLLLVPDVFMLLWRLVNDARVAGKEKVLLVSGIAYFVLPLDFVPEMFVGPVGYLDDLVFGVYILNRLLVDTDASVLREHWSGSDDVLDMIRKVLESADRLVAGDLLKKLRDMAK